MGKIRIKSLGDKEKEKKQKERDQNRREGKKIAKLKGKGGGRIVEVEGVDLPQTVTEEISSTTTAKIEEVKSKTVIKRQRSKKYLNFRSLVDKTKTYKIDEALNIIRKTNMTKFDATVEAHINTLEKGIKGSATLPHGVGKQIRIAIVSDEILAGVEKGKMDFDVLISHPSFMPKLAKLAKTLGPKGLMPNPKNGTISDKPEEAAKKFAGTLQYKTENDFPIIHTIIGKLSFDNQKLTDNFKALCNAVNVLKIKNVYLKATMSPSVRVEIEF